MDFTIFADSKTTAPHNPPIGGIKDCVCVCCVCMISELIFAPFGGNVHRTKGAKRYSPECEDMERLPKDMSWHIPTKGGT